MKKKVMIVDDDPTIRLVIKEVLGRKGFDVVTADGGRECLDKLEKGFKGVILMDIMMPEMDGWDTIREIINQGYIEKNVIAISMLTSKDVPDQKMDGLQEYVIGYLTKPFDTNKLAATIERYFV